MIYLNFGIFFTLMLLYFFGLWKYSKRAKQAPALPVTYKVPFSKKLNAKIVLVKLSEVCFWASIFFLLVALSHPKKVDELHSTVSLAKSEIPRSGIALYFLLDESGSMTEKVTTLNDTGSRVETPKIDLAKKAILQFMNGNSGLNLPGRKDDLVGLISFARVPEVLCPLTLNREEIANKLNAVQPIKDDIRNGTAIGYAIFKAVNIIVATKHFAARQQEAHKSVYHIANQAIIIITDGLQSPHPDDKDNPFRFMPADEAINYAKDNGVRVFYVGIDPVLSQREFADDVAKMRKSMQDSGGELFLASTTASVESILAKIDKMEKSDLPPQVVARQNPVHEESLVHMFVLMAIFALGAGILLETTIVRTAP
ncbi:MAG: VWA domain-containing protein [Chlamydiales bacterium]|nr:VWA domain-containing protein [Chlamydiales bacterium]